MHGKKEIVYPFFLETIQYCEDSFWQTLFNDLAYSKPPSGCYINKGFLCCSYKGKEFSYKIERKEPRILYDEVYALLTERVGILSQKEKNLKKIVFHQLEQDIRQTREKWSNIRRKNIKDTLFEKYVIDMKKKHNLDLKQCKYLLAVIMLSLMFKTITSKDIVYEDDRIQDISGIEFSDGKVMIERQIFSSDDTEMSTEQPSESKLMSENWDRYLKNLRKTVDV